jgi:hypothetical protein
MTRDAAVKAVERLKGLFRSLSIEQGRLLVEEFECYPEQAVHEAITLHAKQAEFPMIPALLALVRQRTPEAADAAAQRRRRELQDEAALARWWKRTEASFASIVRGLSEEALQQLRNSAVQRMDESIRPLYCNRDPRRSRLLRAAIVELFDAAKRQDPPPPATDTPQRSQSAC